MQQLDAVIQQNASASEEMASMSEELNSQSDMMMSSISYFKLKEGDTARVAMESDTKKSESVGVLEAVRPTNKTISSISNNTFDNEFVDF